jgi:hypothetical protein
MKQRQELHCHACNQYVQFDIDLEQNGNHVIICPNCGHEHCRVIENGIITEARWDSRNGYANFNAQYYTTGAGYSSSSVYTTYVVNSGASTDSAAYSYASWNTGGQGSSGYC